MATKPTVLPRWATVPTNNGPLLQLNVAEPDETKKDIGWSWDERPPREWMNWIHRTTYEWTNYFRDLWENAGPMALNWAIDEDLTSGLTVHFKRGDYFFDGNGGTANGSSLLLQNNAINYVYITSAGIASTTSPNHVLSSVRIYSIVTSGGQITGVTDWRGAQWARHQIVNGTGRLVSVNTSDITGTLPLGVSFKATESDFEVKGGASPGTGYSFLGATGSGLTGDASSLRGYVNSAIGWTLTNTGLGIGTQSPATKLDVADTETRYQVTNRASVPATLLRRTATTTNGSSVAESVLGGKNTSSADVDYVTLRAISDDSTTGSMDGSLSILAMNAGTSKQYALIGGDVGTGVKGVETKEALAVSASTDTPILKLTKDSFSGNSDGFQIQPDFGAASLTKLVSYSTNYIEVRPNNQTTMRFDGVNNRVGVAGITSPVAPLHVSGDIRSEGGSSAKVSTYVGASYVEMFNDASNVGVRDSVSGTLIQRSKSNGKATITGPLGVNTADPNYDLEVNGTFSAAQVLGKSYPQTSTSGLDTSIVDTGLSLTGGEIYELSVSGCPSATFSTYRSLANLKVFVSRGNNAAVDSIFVDSVEDFSTDGLHDTDGSLSVSVTLWDGATESDVRPASSSPELRVKVAGYQGTIGLSQSVRIKRIN